MPSDPRISRLLELLNRQLSLATLDHLTAEFQQLAQDRSNTLAFFVLQNVCRELAAKLEGEAVNYERFLELTDGIREALSRVLVRIQEQAPVLDELDSLVRAMFHNLGLYETNQ